MGEARSPFKVIDLTKESIARHNDIFSQTMSRIPDVNVAPFSPLPQNTIKNKPGALATALNLEKVTNNDLIHIGPLQPARDTRSAS